MKKDSPEILVAIEPWTPYTIDSPIYKNGVKVQTLPLEIKRNTPKAKHNGWIHQRKTIMTNAGNGIYEFLLLGTNDNGEEIVLEASGCNFIGLNGDNTLVFPEDDILIGIARAILIDALKPHFNVEFRCPTLKEVLNMKECYLCSASRGIFPIIEINGQLVGNGQPGEIFPSLYTHYNTQLQNELEGV